MQTMIKEETFYCCPKCMFYVEHPINEGVLLDTLGVFGCEYCRSEAQHIRAYLDRGYSYKPVHKELGHTELLIQVGMVGQISRFVLISPDQCHAVVFAESGFTDGCWTEHTNVISVS